MSENTSNGKSSLFFAIASFFVIAAFSAGILIGGTSGRSNYPNGVLSSQEAAYLQSINQILERDYLGDLPSEEERMHGLARGLVDALADNYSSFLSPTEAESYFDSHNSSYEGIGVSLGYEDGYTIVASPIPGSPGEAAGLLPKDIIIEVDSENQAGMRPENVASKIRGAAGTQVLLKIYRASEGKMLDFEITRAEINIDNVSFTKLDNGVGVISIVKFTDKAEGSRSGAAVFNESWDKVVNEALEASPKAIILDLRGNPGGFVDSALYVAQEFLPQDVIVMREREKGSEEKVFRDLRVGKLENLPLVVLVNEGSASASEILAAAIQEKGRGEVVGMPTVGKGVEQKLIPLSDGGLLLLVFRNWLTPDGNLINPESPIKPDIEVEYNLADDAEYDDQLLKAIELLGY